MCTFTVFCHAVLSDNNVFFSFQLVRTYFSSLCHAGRHMFEPRSTHGFFKYHSPFTILFHSLTLSISPSYGQTKERKAFKKVQTFLCVYLSQENVVCISTIRNRYILGTSLNFLSPLLYRDWGLERFIIM